MRNVRRGGSKAVHTGIPDLRFYPLVIYRDCAGGELDTNGRPTFEVEIIAYEAGKHCGEEMSAIVL